MRIKRARVHGTSRAGGGPGEPCSLTSSSNRFFSLAYSIVYDSPLHPRDCEPAWGG